MGLVLTSLGVKCETIIVSSHVCACTKLHPCNILYIFENMYCILIGLLNENAALL
jgi:hypothetical protein